MRRREFLSAAVGSFVLGPRLLEGARLAVAAQSRPVPIVINGMGDLDDPNRRYRPERKSEGAGPDDPWTPRVLRDLAASGLTAMNMTVGHVAGPGDPFEISVRDIARTKTLLRLHRDALVQVESASDILHARESGRVGVILGFQNTTMLGAQPDRVAVFSGLGVKIIQLTYNNGNLAGDGSMAPENRGLTEFGRHVIAELNQTRTLIDLSHSGERTCLEAIEASRQSVVISHAGCRALCDLPRNKSDVELRRLADRGGLVGIYFMPYLKADSFPDAQDAVRHVEHAIQVCGEDHVGVGTDGGTTAVDDLEAFRKVVEKEVADRKAAGIGATGEKPGVLPFLPDLQGPDQFRTFDHLLSARGHSAARIEKILGGNFLRLMRETWGE